MILRWVNVSRIAAAALILLWASAGPALPAEPKDGGRVLSSTSAEEAFRLRRSGVYLTAEGRVVRILKEDRKGIPHQRFIIRLESGHTLLVVHNTAAAPKVPLRVGITLRVRGEYRWNAKGGLLHFTHRPTGGGQSRAGLGGWIRMPDGKLYR